MNEPKRLAWSSIILVLAGSATGSVLAQDGPPEQCPPDCEIGVTLPADVSKRPEVSSETVMARAGEEVAFRPDGRVLVVFPEETPFADRHGQPVYQFSIRANRRAKFRVRDESDELCAEPGCKYMVVDRGNADRPPLDPYIIIVR